MFARNRVESASSTSSSTASALARAARPNMSKGGESTVTFTDLLTYFRARFGAEEGQTMAEYGVVLAVISVLVITALLALSGGISGAIGKVTAVL
jgi:Flp pilus assembly pilin Flp